MSGSFRVDVGFVNSIVAPLRQSVEVAREIHGRSGELAAGMSNCGSGQLQGAAGELQGAAGELQGAAGELLGRWGHAMGVVAEDGEGMATGLDRAGQTYAHAERVIARAATELAEAIPDPGQGSR